VMVRRACSLTIILLSGLVLIFRLLCGEGLRPTGGLDVLRLVGSAHQTDGDGRHLVPAIEAMNALPGRPYPETLGGTVEKPVFVFNLGDISEWPSRAALDTYEQIITKRLKFPSYEIAGNHDIGGLSPNDTVLDWIRQHHGALRYTFEKDGVCFIALFSEYDERLNDPAQRLRRKPWTTCGRRWPRSPRASPWSSRLIYASRQSPIGTSS